MQLCNIQQLTTERVEVYYECLLKLTNCLQVITIDVFFTIVFKASLLPYLKLAIASMKRNTLMEHKKAIVVCEKSGLISLNYDTLLTASKTNTIEKHVIHVTTVKPNIQPIIVNEMVELTTNQPIIEEEVNIEY
jgi:hypothetical protein